MSLYKTTKLALYLSSLYVFTQNTLGSIIMYYENLCDKMFLPKSANLQKWMKENNLKKKLNF